MSPHDIESVDVHEDVDEVSPLPTSGEAPTKWELRSGQPARSTEATEEEAVVDLRSEAEPTVELRPSVRIVDGPYYERRTAGFRSRLSSEEGSGAPAGT